MSRPPRLPETLRIAQIEGSILLEDSLGTAVQAIFIGDANAHPSDLAADVPRFTGEWKGNHLEVKHTDNRGSTFTETYTLEDKGQSLELKTKITGRRTLEFKRTYDRVST